MLLGNYSVLISQCGNDIGGALGIFTYNKPGTWRSFYIGDHVIPDETEKACFPTGTENPNNLVLAFKGGELSASTQLFQEGDVTANLLKGINIESNNLTGSGDIVSSLSLVVQLACDILLSSTLSANLIGKVEMASALAGSGDLSGALSLLAELNTSIVGSGDLNATAFGTADLSAIITNTSTLSPESLAAAVWNSLAATFNTAGTMGNKLNSAASAGDPWSTPLPGSYLSTEAGGILAQIQTLVDELHRIQGLNAVNPMTVDTVNVTRTAGSIVLELDTPSDGVTIVTRQ